MGVVMAPLLGIFTKKINVPPTMVSRWEMVGPNNGVEEGGGFI